MIKGLFIPTMKESMSDFNGSKTVARQLRPDYSENPEYPYHRLYELDPYEVGRTARWTGTVLGLITASIMYFTDADHSTIDYAFMAGGIIVPRWGASSLADYFLERKFFAKIVKVLGITPKETHYFRSIFRYSRLRHIRIENNGSRLRAFTLDSEVSGQHPIYYLTPTLFALEKYPPHPFTKLWDDALLVTANTYQLQSSDLPALESGQNYNEHPKVINNFLGETHPFRYEDGW